LPYCLLLHLGAHPNRRNQNLSKWTLRELIVCQNSFRPLRKPRGGSLPESMPDTSFISEFARTFVQYAREAAENGFKIPQWVLDKLPARKVVVPVLGVMIFTAYGIEFVIPVATVIVAVLGSIALMTTALVAAISELVQPKSKI
jgi:hypothetical protein